MVLQKFSTGQSSFLKTMSPKRRPQLDPRVHSRSTPGAPGFCLFVAPQGGAVQGRRRRGRTRVAGRPLTSPGVNSPPVAIAPVSRPAAGLQAPFASPVGRAGAGATTHGCRSRAAGEEQEGPLLSKGPFSHCSLISLLAHLTARSFHCSATRPALLLKGSGRSRQWSSAAGDPMPRARREPSRSSGRCRCSTARSSCPSRRSPTC
jgi:hypothetical protein